MKVADLDALGLPRVGLLPVPTPVERVAADLWVKREDLAGTVYGGNKVRKLEYLLGEALELGGDVLTLGAVGSHHVLATAVYGSRVGIRVHAVLTPQPDSPHAREVARAIHAHAEQLFPARTYAEVPLVWARARLALRVMSGFPPVLIPVGGSNVFGAMGWVRGGLELGEQLARAGGPLPERIVVPLGSGGTVAGLWIGLRAAGLDVPILAVRTAPRTVGSGPSVRLLARRTLARLARQGLPAVDLGRAPQVVDRQYGGGYGVPTEASQRAERVARELGLELDPTYTAKTFAEVLASRGPRTLFLHTASSRPLAPLLASALDEVPVDLRGLLLTLR